MEKSNFLLPILWEKKLFFYSRTHLQWRHYINKGSISSFTVRYSRTLKGLVSHHTTYTLFTPSPLPLDLLKITIRYIKQPTMIKLSTTRRLLFVISVTDSTSPSRQGAWRSSWTPRGVFMSTPDWVSSQTSSPPHPHPIKLSNCLTHGASCSSSPDSTWWRLDLEPNTREHIHPPLFHFGRVRSPLMILWLSFYLSGLFFRVSSLLTLLKYYISLLFWNVGG